MLMMHFESVKILVFLPNTSFALELTLTIMRKSTTKKCDFT